ncbi:predicted protein [Histoplasma capsulatum var. duboisii H88]|uniref:Predicted protein n=1 Tax=Ajellomyces capsulatus (strain H88) TaxID=544711 RepID=F0URT9_AJEC8|nr:predicted protein [Histoplasma capsulatum var. duboisii H88]
MYLNALLVTDILYATPGGTSPVYTCRPLYSVLTLLIRAGMLAVGIWELDLDLDLDLDKWCWYFFYNYTSRGAVWEHGACWQAGKREHPEAFTELIQERFPIPLEMVLCLCCHVKVFFFPSATPEDGLCSGTAVRKRRSETAQEKQQVIPRSRGAATFDH